MSARFEGPTPPRIKFRDAYASSQPDLDMYREAFEGFGLSPRFGGSDVDGLIVSQWPPHGLWQRGGHFVIMEHKSSPGAWTRSFGQWMALNKAAEIMRHIPGPQRSGRVVVTYGPTQSPDRYHWLPAPRWKTTRSEADYAAMALEPMSFDELETIWARQWIREVTKRWVLQ